MKQLFSEFVFLFFPRFCAFMIFFALTCAPSQPKTKIPAAKMQVAKTEKKAEVKKVKGKIEINLKPAEKIDARTYIPEMEEVEGSPAIIHIPWGSRWEGIFKEKEGVKRLKFTDVQGWVVYYHSGDNTKMTATRIPGQRVVLEFPRDTKEVILDVKNEMPLDPKR